MIVLVKGRKITIDDNLAELAQKYFIDLDERYCKRTLEASLTPDLEHLGKIDFDYEFSIRSDEELSKIFEEALVDEIDMRGGFDEKNH